MAKQKSLTKKQVAKINGGTFIEVWWDGSPNTIALLLERMDDGPGDRPLMCLHRGGFNNWVDSHVTHTQVVRVVSTVTWPEASAQ